MKFCILPVIWIAFLAIICQGIASDKPELRSDPDFANTTDFLTVLESVPKLLAIVNGTLHELFASSSTALGGALVFHRDLLEKVLVDSHEMVNRFKSAFPKEFQNTIEEQLMSLETNIALEIEVIKQIVNGSSAQSSTDNSEARIKRLIDQANQTLVKYPFSREAVALLHEISSLQALQSPSSKVLDRHEKSLEYLAEKASYRLPMQFSKLDVKMPKHVNITEQLNIFGMFSAFARVYEGTNDTVHRNLRNYHELDLDHLTGAYQYQISLLLNIKQHLEQQLSNEDQYFPIPYVRVVMEEDFHLNNQLDAEANTIARVAEETRLNMTHTKTLGEIRGQAGLLRRLAQGFIEEHSHLGDVPAFQVEIEGLHQFTQSLNASASHEELVKYGQTVERHQQTIERLTQRADWYVGHSGGLL